MGEGEKDALSAEQLDRFFEVRQRVDAARRHSDLSLDQMPRKNIPTLEELKQVPGVIQGVSDIVGAEMDAFVEAGMPPSEYHWVERLVYQRWRGPLQPLLLSRIDDEAERWSLDDVAAPFVTVPR